MKYRKKPVVIEAAQWFKHGDHPLDYSKTIIGFENGKLRQFTPEERKSRNWECDVVCYFQSPGFGTLPDDRNCERCRNLMHDHGWIDTLEDGHIVCPGDYIITGVKGEHYPCKPDIFQATYEPVE